MLRKRKYEETHTGPDLSRIEQQFGWRKAGIVVKGGMRTSPWSFEGGAVLGAGTWTVHRGVIEAHRALGRGEALWRKVEFAGEKQAEEERLLRLVQNPAIDEGARAIGFKP